MKIRENFFKENYSKCWNFLIESRWYIVFSLGVFSLLFLVGFTFPIFFREEIINFMSKMILSFKGLNTFEMITFIFYNNIKASFFAMILGIGFGIFPLVTGVINGYLLGFVAREAVGQEGILVLWRLFPHGIFELPAIILSIGFGIKIGVDLIKGGGKERLKYNFKEAMRFFIFIILPLIIIAAIVEGLLIRSLA